MKLSGQWLCFSSASALSIFNCLSRLKKLFDDDFSLSNYSPIDQDTTNQSDAARIFLLAAHDCFLTLKRSMLIDLCSFAFPFVTNTTCAHNNPYASVTDYRL